MLGCGCVLVSYLLTLLLSSSDGLQATSVTSKCPNLATSVEDSRPWRLPGERSAGRPAGKLPPLDPVGNAIKPKRRRLFPGVNAPLDRLSVANMDMKGKKRKEAELARRRASAPIDRIGMRRFPSRLG